MSVSPAVAATIFVLVFAAGYLLGGFAGSVMTARRLAARFAERLSLPALMEVHRAMGLSDD